MTAFRKAFPDRRDVQLTMKMINPGFNINKIGKVQIINQSFSLEELVGLFGSHHVYVYPSYGEGFGLTPLQAMATGMPTITVPDWAPYADHLDSDLNLDATLRRSPWHNSHHPGKMFKPDFDMLVDKFRHAADNYEDLHKKALARVPAIQAKYDWDSLTEKTFSDLEKRIF